MIFYFCVAARNSAFFFRSFLSILIASLALILASPIFAAEQAPMVVDAADVGSLIQLRAPAQLFFLDASPQENYQRVRITGALRASEKNATKPPIPLSSALLVYDFSLDGNGARETARTLMEAGYKSVNILRGGFASAHAAKLPLDTSAPIEDVLPYGVTAQSLVDGLKRQKEEIILLDLRSDIEFSAKHISGATNVQVTDLLAKPGSLNKTKWIVLYDTLGNSLDPFISQLRKAGYLQTVSLIGGYKAWDAQRPKSLGPL